MKDAERTGGAAGQKDGYMNEMGSAGGDDGEGSVEENSQA